jgi:hypothetical protein
METLRSWPSGTRVSRSSQVKLVEAYGGAPGARNFTSAFDSVTLQDGAVLDRVKLQRESTTAFHVARLNVSQARSSRFSDLSVNLGAVLHRHDIDVRFDGEGGECASTACSWPRASSTDTHSQIDHGSVLQYQLSKACWTEIRGVFTAGSGPQDAKTDAHQATRTCCCQEAW